MNLHGKASFAALMTAIQGLHRCKCVVCTLLYTCCQIYLQNQTASNSNHSARRMQHSAHTFRAHPLLTGREDLDRLSM